MVSTGDLTAKLLATADRRHLSASLIFDVTDQYASTLGIAGGMQMAFGPIRFWLTTRNAGTKAETAIDPPLRLATITNPSGFYLWFGRLDGRLGTPEPGTYRVRVESDYYQPLELPAVTFPAPSAPVTCPLEPGYAYPFAGGGAAAPGGAPTLVRGVLQQLDGTPQAGATLTADTGAATVSYSTDATGQFVLVIPEPAPATVSLTVTYPDGHKATLANVPVVEGAESVVPQTALAGQVLSGPPGAAIKLSRPSVTVIPDAGGWWRIVLPLDQKSARATVTATVVGQPPQKRQVQIKSGVTLTLPPFVFPS